MHFDVKKPSHIFALLLILLTFLLIIILPILTFVGVLPSTQNLELDGITDNYTTFYEIMILVFQLLLVITLLIIFPTIYYFLVNNFKIGKVFSHLKLTLENIDIAFLWGILTAVSIFIVFLLVEFLLIAMGANVEELGNIQDLEIFFSPVSMFILIAIQPIAEEFFFRGFLLDKIESFAGQYIAILTTAVLFGLAHMSYQKIYPVIFPMIMGIFLAYLVIKTKNLYSAIVAHITFNLISFILYIVAKSLV